MTTSKRPPAQYVCPIRRAAFYDLRAKGYSPIPIKRGLQRKPCIQGWPQFCERQATDAEIEHWCATFNDCNIAVCGGFNGLVMVDIDISEIVGDLGAVLPTETTGKHGSKGVTVFYRSSDTKSRVLKVNNKAAIEFLGVGRNSTVPPSIHDGTGKPYTWVSPLRPVSELPELPADAQRACYAVLVRHYGPEACSGDPDRATVEASAADQQARPAGVADGRMRAWALKGLQLEAEKVANTDRGGRNTQLFNSVCALGKYVHHSVLSEDEVMERMTNACAENGFLYDPDDGGPDAIRASYESGLRKSENDNLPDIGQLTPEQAFGQAAPSTALVPASGSGLINPNDAIHMMNAYYAAFLHEGGKFRIGTFQKDGSVVMLTKDDFVNGLAHIHTIEKVKSVGSWFITHPQRRTYRKTIFDPNKPLDDDGCYNLWRGFPMAGVRGDWSLMVQHIFEVLCNGVQEHYYYVMRWLAWCIQNPGKVAEVALIFTGGEGTGKGTLGNWYLRLWRQYGLAIHSSGRLIGKFNHQLYGKLFIYFDEALIPGDGKSAAALRALLTEPYLEVEPKGVDVFSTPNFTKVIVASNEEWVVPASADSRRFAVFDVSPHRRRDTAYFTALHDQMKNGGLEAMLWTFQNTQLGDWHPRCDPPVTEALTRQREASLKGMDRVWYEWLAAGEIRCKMIPQSGGAVYVETGDVAKCIVGADKLSERSVGRYFKNFLGDDARKRTMSSRGWFIPSLPEARAIWDRKRFQVQWDNKLSWAMITQGFPGMTYS